jgi:hypothetical protein
VPSTGLLALLSPRLLLVTAPRLRRTLTPATALRRLPLAGLSPATALCRLLPLGWLTMTLAALARLTLALAGPRAPWLTLAGLTVLSRLARLRAYWLLSPTTAALLRRLLPLVRGLRMLLRLLRALAPTTTLAGRLLTPAALTPLSPLLPALAPRLPRTPRSLRRRRHICSF